ncbi:MAG: type II toxin-antitoxin system PemK/MazF family toxin [Sphingobacteriaceae bacterium]|nr:type II toxin-antitoxin system PemK/MazF family toxin [Sphingobacteriaceae bacterium]
MEINQYVVYWIDLDPTMGSEVSKTRPCVVISPDEMNKFLKTVIIAPVTHTLKEYPTRVSCRINGQAGSIMLDQLRTVDKRRIKGKLNKLSNTEIASIKSVINEMLC